MVEKRYMMGLVDAEPKNFEEHKPELVFVMKMGKVTPLVAYTTTNSNVIFIFVIKELNSTQEFDEEFKYVDFMFKHLANQYDEGIDTNDIVYNKKDLYSFKERLNLLKKQGKIKIIESNVDNIIRNIDLISTDEFMENVLNFIKYKDY